MRTLVAVVSVLGLLSCTPTSKSTVTSEAHEVKMDPQAPVDLSAAPEGITLQVTAATDTSDPSTIVNYVPPKATPLSEKDSERLLSRLPKLDADPTLQSTFAMREKSLPPPKAGTTEQLPFPPVEKPEAGPPKPPVEPLTVLRYAPMTDTEIAPELSVTFSQPMVAIGTADQAASVVPVKLSPKTEGNWQWKGAQTLVFAPAERLPMATKFEAEVPAGTKSANGGVLAKAVKWSFATPPPQLIVRYPEDQTLHTQKPVIVLGFNQRVNREAVAKFVTIKNGWSKLAFRFATPEELRADASAQAYIKSVEADHAFALVPTEELPLASKFELTLAKGAPSAEGPLTAVEAQAFKFATYGPFVYVKGQCHDKPCRPTSYVSMEFSNPIDQASFAGRVHISPETPGVSAVLSHDHITLDGRKKARTRYSVTVDKGLKDIHGQELAKTAVLTFETAGAEPHFALAKDFFLTMTPDAPSVDVWATGQPEVKVEVYKVTPADWNTYREFARSIQYYDDSEKKPIPGKRLRSEKLTIADPDEMAPTAIDISGALEDGVGNAVIVVTGRQRYRDKPMRQAVWAQVTRLALDAFDDNADLAVWVTELANGKPVKGVSVAVVPSQSAKADSDSDGLARIHLDNTGNEDRILVATKGKDTTFLPGALNPYGGSRWRAYPLSGPSVLAYVTDDRGMYKPGETAHIKGWFRQITSGKNGKLEMNDGKSIRYYLRDPENNEVARGTASISALGGFDFAIELPKTMHLGSAYLAIGFRDPSAKDDKEPTDSWSTIAYHSFQVQEFRRPEFEVSAQVSGGVHLVGETANATVKAAYYAGGALQGAPVNWNVVASKGSFTPPGRDSFIFGLWEPWWRHGDYWGGRGERTNYVVTGTTDSSGQHRIDIATKSVKPERATSIEATATVADVNRQRWTARANLLVHAATTYIGVKPERMFTDPNKEAKFDLIAADLDGKAVVGAPIHLTVTRYGYKVIDGQYRELTEKVAEETLSSTDRPLTWTFKPKEGGRHDIHFDVRDGSGRLNATDISLWVSGEKRPSSDSVDKQEVTLIPSKKTYAPGDTAEILVQSPFTPAEGVAIIEREGLVSTERFSVVDGSATLKIPITKEMAPNFLVQVQIAGQQGEGKKTRPAHAGGTLAVDITTDHYGLKLDVAPQSRSLSPGESTTVNVTVKDAAGKGVGNAEVAVIVVDESVLALSSFQLRDPLAVMVPRKNPGVNSSGIREAVVVARAPAEEDAPEMMKEMEDQAFGGSMPRPAPMMSAPGSPMRSMAKKASMDKSEGGGGDTPIEVRSDFSALAAFVPKLVTDSSGKVSTQIKLPDNLTRYRVMAVSAAALQFGKGESTITARLPLMVRPSAPRFLNFGDHFELPAVVQNQTDEALEVDVVVRALNMEVPRTGLRVRVDGGQRVEVRFPAGTIAPGTARFQVGAASGTYADAADVKLRVWTPATSEAFATYGVLDGDAAIKQPVSAPADVFSETGGLTVSTSSTTLQSLTDAMLYLAQYPFDCTEQVSSRMLGIVAMKDVLGAFKSKELPDPKDLLKVVDTDLEVLKRRQAGNGGFGFWERNRVSPYASVHATHALVRTKAAGYAVPEDMLAKALKYTANVERELSDEWPEAKRYIVAYALAVRALAGDADVARAKKLVNEQGIAKTSVETLGFVLRVAQKANDARFVDEIVKALNQRVTETAASAHFVTRYNDGAHLIMASEKRADAIVLGSLIAAKPQSDLIPKVIRGLMDGRRRGRWLTTQENVFVMLAIGEYFNAFEKQTPDFVARLWLGEHYAGEAAFHGRETVTRELTVPMKELADGKGHDLVVQKKGAGRMYYRIGLDYTPKSLNLAARDNGFEVSRVYEPIDDPSTVTRDADGTWRVKAGARVRVRLKMVAPAVRYFVALVDPMPAGFEAVNAALAVSEDLPDDDGEIGLYEDDEMPRPVRRGLPRKYVPWWLRTWFDHQNMRDERVEAFTDQLYAGVHEYTYVARATTPGTFIVPPTKAEEMYAPETFGRAASEKVIVE